jgi:hypothetical protein
MNCDECKNLIGVFMDNELEETQASAIRMHLAACTECAGVCEDLASILDVCTTNLPLRSYRLIPKPLVPNQ